MSYNTLEYTVNDGIAMIKLNRPESFNAIDLEVREELVSAIEEVEKDDLVRVLVITGAGKAFSAGGDVKKIKNLETLSGRNRVLKMNKVILALANLEKPVISAVNGIAVGAGCNLALAADITIASENAKFGQVFVKIGMVPDGGGSFFLPRLIGLAKAKELIFTGEIIPAKKAEEIGLINKVVHHDQFDSEVNAWAEKMSNGPVETIGLAKKIINKGLNMDLESVLELEAVSEGFIRQTAVHKEGLNALLEKREPNFKRLGG